MKISVDGTDTRVLKVARKLFGSRSLTVELGSQKVTCEESKIRCFFKGHIKGHLKDPTNIA